MNDMLFVLERGSEIAVESAEEAQRLEKTGWKVIASIEPKAYIKSLLLEYPALVRILKGL